MVVGRGGNRTTHGLKNQGEKVKRAEDDSVGPWTEATGILAVNDDDAGQTQVDGAGEEGRTDGEAAQVDQEGVVVEDVVVEHETASVTDELEGQATQHGHHEAPGLAGDAEEDLWNDEDGKDDGVEDIAPKVRNVGELAQREIADIEVAKVLWIEAECEVAIALIVVDGREIGSWPKRCRDVEIGEIGRHDDDDRGSLSS